MLEPEHDLVVLHGRRQCRVAAREVFAQLRERRVAFVRQKPRAHVAQIGRLEAGGNRTLVEHVAPWQHRPGDARPADRAGRAIAIGDMQHDPLRAPLSFLQVSVARRPDSTGRGACA